MTKRDAQRAEYAAELKAEGQAGRSNLNAKQAAAIIRKILADTDGWGCESPCLRDDLGDVDPNVYEALELAAAALESQ